TFQNHTDCPLTDFGGKTSIFSHPVYLFLRKFSLQDSRGGSPSGRWFQPSRSINVSANNWFLIRVFLPVWQALLRQV
ncbi:hypothetical protein ACP8ZP_23050, partial [Escherichia coli]